MQKHMFCFGVRADYMTFKELSVSVRQAGDLRGRKSFKWTNKMS